MIITKSYHSTFGKLILGSFDNQLCLLDWKYRKMRSTIDKRIQNHLKTEFKEGNSKVIEETITQLTEYFSGKRKSFDIPLLFAGTDFQKSVWKHLTGIPYGQTSTYSELSDQLKNPGAIRAIAAANGANALAILVPCHRIIGSDGSMVGYAGGIKVKRELLKLEGVLTDPQIRLFE